MTKELDPRRSKIPGMRGGDDKKRLRHNFKNVISCPPLAEVSRSERGGNCNHVVRSFSCALTGLKTRTTSLSTPLIPRQRGTENERTSE